MDIEILNTLAQNPRALPEGDSITALTEKLLAYLGSSDMNYRERSLDILCAWIDAGAHVYYAPSELIRIGQQMAHNLKWGIGEQGTDSVFLRAFSVLVLNRVIDADNKQPFLEAPQVREWLELGLAYLRDEQDRRGWVAQKGWAHAIAHASDLFWVLTRSRYVQATELELILNAIADKVIEPTEMAFVYEEDERLVSAVMSALLRNLLDMPALTQWLRRMTHPAEQTPWSQVMGRAETGERLVVARANTITFLRSLYFQLLLGNQPHSSFAQRMPAVRDDLLARILDALRAMDRWVYARNSN